MEVFALKSLLTFLTVNCQIRIRVLVTDRSTSVRKMLAKDFPSISHQFDIWWDIERLSDQSACMHAERSVQYFYLFLWRLCLLEGVVFGFWIFVWAFDSETFSILLKQITAMRYKTVRTHVQHTHYAWTTCIATQINCPPAAVHFYCRALRHPGLSIVNTTSLSLCNPN